MSIQLIVSRYQEKIYTFFLIKLLKKCVNIKQVTIQFCLGNLHPEFSLETFVL